MADTQTTKFHFLILAKIRSTRRGRVERELHVRFLRELGGVPSPIFSLSRRGAAPGNSGISFVLGTPPRLTGLELPCVQRTPQATGGRPPAGPTQRSQPSGHPKNSIWAGY